MENNVEQDELVDVSSIDSVAPIYLVPLTEEELRTQEAMSLQMQEQRLAEESRELAKQSALAKLALLGLTEEEARAVIGL
jgi:hypothetical protein